MEATETRSYFDPPALEFSQDGSRIAFTVTETNVRVCDVATGSVLSSSATAASHWSIALAPEGHQLAAGQLYRSIRIIDPETGELDFELHGHSGSVTHLAYGARDQLLSVSSDETIRVWDVARREETAIFDAPGTTRAEFVDDEHILSLTGGRFRLWTLENRRVHEFVGHRSYVYGAVFSGDGGLLVTTVPSGDAIVWDPLEPEVPLRRFPSSGQHNLAFDAQGENLVYSGGVLVPWSIATGVPTAKPRSALTHGWSRAGKLVVQGAEHELQLAGPTVFRTEYGSGPGGLETRAFVDGQEIEPGSPRVAPDPGPHPMLFLGGREQGGVSLHELLVFDGPLSPGSGAAIDAYLAKRRTGDNAELPRLEAGPDLLAHFRADPTSVHLNEAKHVLSWSVEGDANRRLEVRGGPGNSITFVPAESGTPAHVRLGHGFGAWAWLEMAFPEVAGKSQLTVCWLGNYVADLNGPQLGYSIGTVNAGWPARDPRITKPGRPISISSNGKYMAHSVGGAVDVRDSKTGYGIAHFAGAQYQGVSFHPDSQRLALGTTAGEIEIFDVTTQQRIASIAAHADTCYDVAFSPDGTRIASAGNDNSLRIWDANTLGLLLELPGHRSYVMALSWSPDGTMLASASGDHGVRIWDSVPPSQRYTERIANRALALEVSAEVEALHRKGVDRGSVVDAIRQRWPNDAARRRAALKVLARL